MSSASPCPDPDELRRLVLGEMDESTAGGLELHVRDCPECGRTLRGLDVADDFTSVLRAHARIAPADNDAVGSLIRQLKAAHTAVVPGADETPTFSRHQPKPAELALLAPAEAPDELGRLGGYRVLRVLGRGGMGVVFLAEDVALRRHVALKAMRPDRDDDGKARQRFLREARAAAAIEHDHIVPIYQVGDDRGVPFLAMQLLRGETLEERLRRDVRLPPDEVVRLGREIALGLAAAHERGLVHRDIKPANIFLVSDGPHAARAKLVDFGLARPSEDAARLTQSGDVLGTPAYMAPEQAAGGVVDFRCDLFSLSCVLYLMATGELPFSGANVMATLNALATHEPPSPAVRVANVPPALSNLIMTLLAKDPGDRPESARAVADALGAMAEGRLVPALRRGPSNLVLAAGVVCLLIVIAVVAYQRFGGAATPSEGAGDVAALPTAIQEAYRRLPDAASVLGRPVGVTSGFELALVAKFEHGVIILPPGAKTARVLHGPFHDEYRDFADLAAKLGQPLSDVQAGFRGAEFMKFERGEMIVPPGARAAYSIYGPIYQAYTALADVGSILGHPLGGVQGGTAGATYVAFDRGQIILPPDSTQAFVIQGDIFQAYLAVPDHGSAFGHPKSNQYSFENGLRQDFQRGHILATAGGTKVKFD